MTDPRLAARLARRATHRSRSAAVSVVLVLCILVVASAGVECVLAALGRPPLWLSPTDAVAALAAPGPVALAAAAIAAVLAVILLAVALTPARLHRHRLADERMVVVVDDGALAGALRHAAVRAARVSDDRVRASVGRRAGTVRVTPTSGLPLDAVALTATATTVIEALDVSPRVRARVAVAERGVVGS